MREGTKTSALLKRIRERNPSWFVLKHNQRLTGGVPDVTIVRDKGRHVWIEFKVEGNVPTPLQTRTMARLVYAGALVLLVTFNKDGTQDVQRVLVDGTTCGGLNGKHMVVTYLEALDSVA